MGQNILHSVFEFLFLVPSLFITGGRRRRAFMPRGFAARFCKQSLVPSLAVFQRLYGALSLSPRFATACH
jgi:hypothetical protein